MLSLRTFLIITIFNLPLAVWAQQTQQTTPKGTRFFLYTPPGYAKNSSVYPLLVSLHGLGNVGSNLDELITSRDVVPAKLIHENKWPSTYPFIVVTPQLNPGVNYPDDSSGWPPSLVNELIEFVQSTQAVDVNRIYLTGLSMGARGTWDYAAAYPAKLAAMVPIAGITDTTKACSVKNIPTWVFHGSNDGVVDPDYSINMVNAVKKCVPAGAYIPHLTILHGQKHEGWSGVYDNSSGYNIYDWLLKFSKSDNSNKSPYVNAGSDLKIVKRDQPLHLYGEYFDADGSILSVTWNQISGPSIKQESNNGFLKLSDLSTGLFEFELSATDNKGSQQKDRVIVEIVGSLTSEPAVTDLILINEATDQPIGKLNDEYLINQASLGTNKINIKAGISGDVSSVSFRINGNHNLQTTNNPGPFLLMNQGWVSEEGEYLICATPFNERDREGKAGISQCFKIIVSKNGKPVITGLIEQNVAVEFYPNPATDHIILKSADGSDSRFIITNSSGMQLWHGEISSEDLRQGFRIDTTAYPPGIYFLILNDRKSVRTTKFIIN